MGSRGMPGDGDQLGAVGSDEPTVIDAQQNRPEPENPPPATPTQGPSETGSSGDTASDATVSGTTRSSTTGGTSATSLALTRGASGVTTASPLILRAEEQARTVALMRLVMAVAVAGVIAVWLPRKDAPGRWLSTIVVSFTFFVSLWQVLELRDPARFDRRKVLFHGLCCVASILSVAFYVGVFSPAIIAMYVGIYFFGLSDSSASGWTIYGTGAAGYLALDVLAMTGVISTQSSVVPLGDTELSALLAITLVCQVLFATTFWMARSSRGATLAAFERLERAGRQIRQRDALLDEARADLDRERAANVGRFTDQQVGKYAIAEIIGRGAMGEVYRAFDSDADRAVAVKFLSASLTEDPSSVERFFREVEVAGRIKSDHIVRVFDHGVAEGGSPFLVMELLEGRDLAQVLREKKRLGMSAALQLVEEVSKALSAADEAGIVHRDLKPQNLFQTERGERRGWKVLDFGVSKILEASKDLTMGAAVGTPSYMSPEQARGEPVDHRADVFALGVVAYRVLTGRPAFTAPDSPSTLYNVVHVQPVRPGELARVGPDVERVLALALAKERERRLSSALMLSTSLREAARHRLDERLRRDADELLAEHPWGSDLLQLLKSRSRQRALSSLGRASKPPKARASKPPKARER
jgi:serine/threonine protein kinase